MEVPHKRFKYSFGSALLVFLAACTQIAPIANPELSPLTFGSAGYDYAYGLARHSSGVYAAGYTDGNLHGAPKGGGDAFVRKYDTFGAVVWGRQFGTPQYDVANSVASDSGNNAYVGGDTGGSLAGSRGNQDLFLRKYSSSGGVVWTRQFGTPYYDFGGDVAVIGSNVYVAGTVYNAASFTNGYLAKFNASGSQLWTRNFGTSDGDWAYDVDVDSSGNAYVVGFTYGNLGGINGGGSDLFVRKYTPTGGIAWTRQYHYSDQDYGQAISVTGSSVYVVSRWDYLNDPSDVDVRILKLNSSGTTLWDLSLGPVGGDYVYDVDANSSGVVFSGETYTAFSGTYQGGGDGFVYKLNSSGTPVWGRQQGTSSYDATGAVLIRSSSEVYAAGWTYGVLGSGNSGNADAFLRRHNGTNGNTVWTDQ